MKLQLMIAFLKKNWLTIVLSVVLLLIIFVPDAKSLILRSLFSVGLFKPGSPFTEHKRDTSAANISFTFLDENNQPVELSSLRNKIVFINFWADWCPPCRAEMPSINSLYNELNNDPRYYFILLHVDGNRERGLSYMHARGFDLPVALPAGNIPTELFQGPLPTTIVIDAGGKITFRHEGVANYSSSGFISGMKKLAEGVSQ